MDAFKDLDNVTVEKANAMLRYRRLRNIAKLFRLVELCLALLFLSWVSARLPFVARISADYLRRLVAVVTSPLFIFALSNVIVITLLVKSGRSSAADNADPDPDLYEEFIKSSENRANFGPDNSLPVPEPEKIIYQDKQIISEVININNTITTPKEGTGEVTSLNQKSYRRSLSENLKRGYSEKPSGKLRRSETEICRKIVSSDETPANTVDLEDELSNEDFQRKIDAFIANQVKFHKQEKLAIVLRNHTIT